MDVSPSPTSSCSTGEDFEILQANQDSIGEPVVVIKNGDNNNFHKEMHEVIY